MTAPRTKSSPGKTRGAEERRERFSFLLLISLILHVILILLLALFFTKRAEEADHKSKNSSQPPPPEVTLEIPPPATPERPIVEAHTASDKTPLNAPFQSDQNTEAASELPSTGSAPVPTEEGVKQPGLELQTQQYTPGEKASASNGNPAHPAAPPSTSSPASPPQKQQQQKPAPTPAPKSGATPQPTPLIPPPPNNVKLLELPTQPTPGNSLNQPTAAQHPPQEVSPPATPGTTGPKKGYEPETRQTVLMGSISNRGRSSVAAIATPLGRYHKIVADAIGSRWYYYVNEQMGLLSIGTVSVRFDVTSAGRITELHVVSSNSNESLTDCSLRSIMDAKLPPIPPDLAATLRNGSLEIDYSFTIY